MIDQHIPSDGTTRHQPDLDLASPNPFGSLSVLNECLGGGSLENNLVNSGISRALEVGVGWNFTTMKQLARLSLQDQPIFSAENLLAIDFDLPPDENLADQLGTYEGKFRRERISVEQLQNRIIAGSTPPFDLIISEGVASAGWENVGLEQTDHEGLQKNKESLKITLQAMRDCMNSNNPQALLMMSSKLEDEFLLLSRQDFEEAGLEVVHFLHADNIDWLEALQEAKIFPPEYDDAGYRLVICKVKQ